MESTCIYFLGKISHFLESEWSIIMFSKHFKIQFAWPTFQKRSWTVMTITSTNQKGTNAWEIPSMETYFNKHNDQETRILVKRIFLFSWNLVNSNFSFLISSCNFDVEKNSLCVYVRYEYTEWHHWSRAARQL